MLWAACWLNCKFLIVSYTFYMRLNLSKPISLWIHDKDINLRPVDGGRWKCETWKCGARRCGIILYLGPFVGVENARPENVRNGVYGKPTVHKYVFLNFLTSAVQVMQHLKVCSPCQSNRIKTCLRQRFIHASWVPEYTVIYRVSAHSNALHELGIETESEDEDEADLRTLTPGPSDAAASSRI